jgi:uncharacterized membrane protein
MIVPLAEAKADKDEDAFRGSHPFLWWITLVGPFVLTVFVLFMVWEVAGTKALSQLVATAVLTFLVFGKFVILGGSDGQLLDSVDFFTAEQLVAIVLYMDLMTACVLVSHMGFMFRLPVLGAKLRPLIDDGEFILRSHPWMKRATFLGLVAFVMFPLAATGSVGGSIFGRLLGMSRLGTFIGLAIGNILGCALMYFGSELITRYVGRDNPWLLIGGIAFTGSVILMLNHRYRQLKSRQYGGELAVDSSRSSVAGFKLQSSLKTVARTLGMSFRDLLPIILTVGVFQLFVFRQPLDDVGQILIGLILVVIGLALFVKGLELGLFPLGESMAHALARKGSVGWLIAFAFALGFGTTFAEPALIAIAGKAADLQVAGIKVADVRSNQPDTLRDAYAISLRITVALAVGTALVVGVLRIIKGWPIHYLIMASYALVLLLTPFAPQSIVAVAYDSGGVTTSTITVPLTTALGIGLASNIKGRNPLLDGFGLIAFASLAPILFVLIWGIVCS